MITNKDEILAAADTLEVIEAYANAKLKRQSNGQFLGLCPFHDEKTPSFRIYPGGNYKCYGCGESGGDPAAFLMEHQHMTFPEALTALATKYNIDLIKDSNYDVEADREVKDQKLAMYNALREVGALYLSHQGISYDGDDNVTIAGKTYTKETVEKWNISIAPKMLISKSDIDKEILHDALGIIKKSTFANGIGYYDQFGGRLLFPFYDGKDHTGEDKLIGYSARLIEPNADKKVPKYVNSDQSLIFNKSKIMYGLHQNRSHIVKAGTAIVVEGQTDVVMLDQAGCSLAVACSSKAFTIDMAKKMKKYTDEAIIMLDGLDSSKKGNRKPNEIHAAMGMVDKMIAAQIMPLVYLLPDDMDPADFAKQNGSETEAAIMAEAQDALEWKIQKMTSSGSVANRTKALQSAVQIVATIDDKMVRKMYSKNLHKMLGVTATAFNAEVEDHRAPMEELTPADALKPHQEESLKKYGLYISGKRYMDHQGNPVSNFIMRPLFLVRQEKSSERIFHITNEEGAEEYIQLDQSNMISLSIFRTEIERLGNFVFYGKDDSFVRLRMLNYAQVPYAYPIITLGYHRHGFWAMANGIIERDGTWIPIDDEGLVTIIRDDKEIRYFLPEHSKLKATMHTDEAPESDLLQSFTYEVSHLVPHTFSEWAAEFEQIIGHRGMMPMAFFLATIFRDYIFGRFDFFPILNLFGPAGSGKTFTARCLSYLFGKPLKSVNTVLSTKSAFYRTVAQLRNVIRIYEEYSEQTSEDFQEGLKNMYDGHGRPLSKINNSYETKTTPVYSTVALIGQILPTNNVALMERICTEYFVKIDKNEEEKARATAFELLGKKGYYSKYLTEIHALREHFIRHFADVMSDTTSYFLSQMTGSRRPATRVLNNYSILLTSYRIIADKIKLPYKVTDMTKHMMERMESQSAAVAGAEELSAFWEILIALIDRAYAAYYDKKLIYTIKHFYAEESTGDQLRKKPKGKAEMMTFTPPKKLLYINLGHTFTAFKEMASKLKVDATRMQRGNLEYYLMISPAFVGIKRGKRLNGSSATTAWVFDIDMIPDGENIRLSKKVKDDLDRYGSDGEVDDDQGSSSTDEAYGNTLSIFDDPLDNPLKDKMS